MVCSILFFLLGVFFGQGHQSEGQMIRIKSEARPDPVEDVQPQLNFYSEMLEPDRAFADSAESNQAPQRREEEPSALPGNQQAAVGPTENAGVVEPEPPSVAKEEEAPPEVNRNRLYTVQVAAHRTRDEAAHVVSLLAAKGYSGKIVDPTAAIRFYRVCVGETESQTEALSLAERLQEAGFRTYVRPSAVGDSSN
jgi:cell division protein FtsN